MVNDSGSSGASSTLLAWTEGSGDDAKYHIAHVSPEGITLVCKIKDQANWAAMVATAKSLPNEAESKLRAIAGSVHLARNGISKAAYTAYLDQLTLFDRNQKKITVPEGKEQEQVFQAIAQHLGGTASEEDADAWSVMKPALILLAIVGAFGGFFIWLTTVSDPNYVASGRRSGMKALINWLGYTIGPFWSSVIVGTALALILAVMIALLIKRPVRKVLTFSS